MSAPDDFKITDGPSSTVEVKSIATLTIDQPPKKFITTETNLLYFAAFGANDLPLFRCPSGHEQRGDWALKISIQGVVTRTPPVCVRCWYESIAALNPTFEVEPRSPAPESPLDPERA